MATIKDDCNVISLAGRKSVEEDSKGFVGNVVNPWGSAIMGNHSFVIPVWLSSSGIGYAGTMATVMEEDLVSISNSRVVDKECLESPKNCCARSLVVSKHMDMVIGNAALIQQKDAHGLYVVDTSTQIVSGHRFSPILVNAD